MPTTPDMSMDMTTVADSGLLDTLQHEVAVFARRAEQTRLGGVGQVLVIRLVPDFLDGDGEARGFDALALLADDEPLLAAALGCGSVARRFLTRGRRHWR